MRVLTIWAILLVILTVSIIFTPFSHPNPETVDQAVITPSATTPVYRVSLDANSLSQTDTIVSANALQTKSFRVGAVINSSATNPLTGVSGWQFSITYNKTLLVPQGDPWPANPSYPDAANSTVLFGTGTPNWAGLNNAAASFGSFNIVNVNGSTSLAKVEVFWAALLPTPAQNINSRQLLANVQFELVSKPTTSQLLTVRDVIFVNSAPTPQVIHSVIAGTNATETITNDPPHASFTASPAPSVSPTAFTFNGSGSSDPDDTITSPGGYFWDFGDGMNDLGAIGSIVTHDYGVSGVFNATLRVQDSLGATGSARDSLGTIIVNHQPSHTSLTVGSRPDTPPTAAFTFHPLPSQQKSIVFDSSNSTDPDGTIVSYHWDFGDAATFNQTQGISLVHVYSQPGNYTVVLTVVDNANLSGSVSHLVLVLSQTADEPPSAIIASFPNNPSTNQGVTFDGTRSSDPDGQILTWYWSFGDGFTTNGVQVTHSYTSPGNYTVTLTVTDSSSQTASVRQVVQVHSDEPPIASFTFSPNNPSTGQTVFFESNSSDPDGFIVSTSWSFGDGSQGFFFSFVQHSYISAGNYTVTLTVNDSNGQSASTSKVVQVHARPLHDVAIEQVSAYPQIVVGTQTVNVQVVVENTGSSNETVSVTAYYGSNIIGTLKGIFLFAPCNFCSNYQYVQFLWDTSGVAPGNYTISATVFLSTDQSPSDNSMTDGQVKVLPPPTLGVTPTSGGPGTTVLVKGAGFPLNPYNNQGIGYVEVTFDDQLIGFTNSHNGSFTFTFSIPLSQGAHLIKALDESSGAHASTGFQVLSPPAPGTLAVTVDVGTLYFPGETVVIYAQTSLNGLPVNPANIQLQLFRPNGSSVTLSTQLVAQGLFKASFPVPLSGSIGTYLITVKAHTVGPLDASETGSFEVKPTWLSSQGHTLATGVAGVFLAGMVVVSWRRGYFRRKEDEFPTF